MKIRHLLFLFSILLLLATAGADVPLEKSLPLTAPLPPVEPPNAVGLIILAIVLAHVCLPLCLLGYLLLGWIVMKLFRTSLPMLAMGIVQRGGLQAFKKIGIALGVLIVLPSGFMGLRWAARILEHPMDGATAWVFGFGISVVTGIVFLALVKAIARRVKQQLAGKMGGMMGGFGQAPFGEKPMKPAKRGGQRPPDRKKLR
jgi:hypothetical protein